MNEQVGGHSPLRCPVSPGIGTDLIRGTVTQQGSSMTATGTEARVVADIAKRQQLGINKYGTTVAANPLDLREWLQHAYEEALDLAVYLRRAMEELDKRKDDLK